MNFYKILVVLIIALYPCLAVAADSKSKHGRIFNCNAEWGYECSMDAGNCQLKDSIVAEQQYSLDAGKKLMTAALYTAVFEGKAAIIKVDGTSTASGVLSAPEGNPAGKMYVKMTVDGKNFSVIWHRPDDATTLSVLFGKCSADEN